MRAKGTLYDVGLETALLMRLPGTIPEGQQLDPLIQNLDLAPTLLEAAGVPVPERMQGRSFWPLVTGKAYTPHAAIVQERNYHSDFDPMRAIRTPRSHYIRNFAPDAKRCWLPQEVQSISADPPGEFLTLFPPRTEPRAPEELYDLATDPHERQNLATDPAQAGLLADLRARLDRWMRENADPLTDGIDALPKPAIRAP